MRRLCKVLEVHPSGFYVWRLNPESCRAKEDKRLLVPIKESWKVAACTAIAKSVTICANLENVAASTVFIA